VVNVSVCSFVIDNGAQVQANNKSISGSGTFWIKAGGTLLVNNGTAVNWPNASGCIRTTSAIFDPGANYVLNGAAATQNMGAGFPSVVNNLTINDTTAGASVALQGNVIVNGQLTLQAGILALGGNTLTLNGPAISNSGGSMSATSSSSLIFGGSSTGVAIPTGVSTLGNLTVNNPSGVSLGSVLTMTNNSSTLSLLTGHLTGVASYLTLGTNATIIVNNTGTPGSVDGAPKLLGPINVNYTGNTSTTTGVELPATVLALRNYDSGGLTLNSSVTVTNYLNLYDGQLNLNGQTVTLAANATIYVNNTNTVGTISGPPILLGTVNVTYNGSNPITTTANELPVSTTALNNLTINDTAGVTLDASRTVNGILNFGAGSGSLATGSGTLTLGANAIVSGAGAGQYINGNLAKIYGATGSQIFNTFDIGDGTSYTPVTMANLNLSAAGTLTASTVPNHNANGQYASSGLSASQYVERTWTLTPSGGLAGTYDLTLNFATSDLIGSPNTAQFAIREYSGGGWSLPTISIRTGTSTSTTGLGGFGDFVIGQTLAAVSSSLDTDTKSAITNSTATLGATVETDGGSAISDYGIVWGLAANPTTSDNKVQAGTSVTPPAAFTISATGLPAGSLINYRGYAINSVGTGYSTNDSFYTLSTAPSAQPASFTAMASSPSNVVSIVLSWAAAPGANGYLLLQTNGTVAPVGTPVDAIRYNAGSTNLGPTVLAFITNGVNSFTNTGLSVNATYSYALYPFNWDGTNAATINYLTAGALTATATTEYALYRSVTSGSWSDYTIWQRSVNNGANWSPAGPGQIPTGSSASVLIQSPETVTVTNNVTSVNVTVAHGGTLAITGGILTVNHSTNSLYDLDVHGTLNLAYANALTLGATNSSIIESDGALNHTVAGTVVVYGTGAALAINGSYFQNVDQGRIPVATWGALSTCEIDSTIASAPSGDRGYGQNFGNFIWNGQGGQTFSFRTAANFGASQFNCAGTFTIESTGGNPSTVTMGNNNWTNSLGAFVMTGGYCTLNTGTSYNYTQLGVNGSFQITGGSFGAGTAASVVYAGGDVSLTGGSVSQVGTLIFTKAGVQNFTNTLGASLGLTNIVNSGSLVTMDNASTLSVGTLSVAGAFTNNGTVIASRALSGPGNFVQGTNATLNLAGAVTVASLDASSQTPNLVDYTGASQAILGTPYNNLTLDGSNVKLTAGNNPGTVTVNGDFNLNGSILVKVNIALSPSNDTVNVTGALASSGAGPVTVTNLGPRLNVGQSFYLFNHLLVNGAALTVSDAGTNVTWANNLVDNGNIAVASVVLPPIPVIAEFSLTGTTVNLSLTNGTAGGAWTLLQSTNLALPLSQWETNRTGTYDGSGNLSTNIVNTATNLQEFYILKQ
jgi:hypothetical protein